MKVVILAGGFGTRLSEETDVKPKPMVEIGGKPILWHIMKIYSAYGFNDFIICLGYKGYIIKEYFANYFLHMSDVTIDLKNNQMEIHNVKAEPWKVTLVDTGLNTMTGGRIKRIQSYIMNETFMLTYGDGVGDINIKELLEFHKKHGKYATLTAVQPSGRFGALDLNENEVKAFEEKPKGDGSWINGGFFVLQPQIFDYIKGDDTIWEKEPLENLAKAGQLISYKHTGFWKPMDTLRDKRELEALWQSKNAPWKVWNE
ncbi:glucose-1-phosphate cytidylyltransferase [Deferribacteraceae bacterium V6Fe1]|nr:glucose-1-phosphate cytidylyltransferase [Deferribacteraceae bacterium V6Fe1]